MAGARPLSRRVGGGAGYGGRRALGARMTLSASIAYAAAALMPLGMFNGLLYIAWMRHKGEVMSIPLPWMGTGREKEDGGLPPNDALEEEVGVHRLVRGGKGGSVARRASIPAAADPQERSETGTRRVRVVDIKGATAADGKAAPQTQDDGGYDHWRAVVHRLASLPPVETLSELTGNDPFGVRTFDAALKRREIALERVLTRPEMKSLFPCPHSSDRLTLPDKRDHSKSAAFRNGEDGGTFLFFQHLRKAGGTNFCALAEKNLPRSARPGYYCMPDWKWSGRKTAGYLHHYANEELERRMKEDGFRVAGNEWDDLDPTRHFDLPAVFATSFRSPLDRALSQFRFECVEDRGCKIKDVETFWKRREDLHNIYALTFADPPQGGGKRKQLLNAYTGEKSEDGTKRAELLTTALDALSRFHLVLTMEWLAYAEPLVTSVLGFTDTSTLTQRVRPHIGQANRNDGQEKNELGSAGIGKASWNPKEYLSAEQYEIMSKDLALDEVLTDAARRMFLERLVCEG